MGRATRVSRRVVEPGTHAATCPAAPGLVRCATLSCRVVEERVIHSDGEHVVMYSTRMYVCAFQGVKKLVNMYINLVHIQEEIKLQFVETLLPHQFFKARSCNLLTGSSIA
jgi:hypothetical protein